MDFPCICGHSKDCHFVSPENIHGEGSCHLTVSGKILNYGHAQYVDNCDKYKPDNLRYLEMVEKEKHGSTTGKKSS